MRGKRLRHTLRLWTILSPAARVKYIKNHDIFYSMGDNCSIMSRTIPIYPKLIKLGNNVHLASDVLLVPHDITHAMLNKSRHIRDIVGDDYRFHEKVGCIEIGDDVFIGARTIILPDVRIGSHVIIGAASLVNKDIPDNCVAAGVPARVVCPLDEYLKKRAQEETYPTEIGPFCEPAKDGKKRKAIGDQLLKWCWDHFHEKRAGSV